MRVLAEFQERLRKIGRLLGLGAREKNPRPLGARRRGEWEEVEEVEEAEEAEAAEDACPIARLLQPRVICTPRSIRQRRLAHEHHS